MKKVLICDDYAEVRDLIEVTLSMGRYQILHAENGDKALEIAKTEIPDLILMDVVMPGKTNGLEATRIIKNDQETKGCKIIMLTSLGHDADRAAGLVAGADDYLIKPFSPLELIKKVEELIG